VNMVEGLKDLRYEIEQLLELAAKGEKHWEWEGVYETDASSFIRAHGHSIVSLMADAERIEWLQGHAHTIYTAHDLETFGITHFVVVHETSGTRKGNVAPTVREAIDLARTKAVAGGAP